MYEFRAFAIAGEWSPPLLPSEMYTPNAPQLIVESHEHPEHLGCLSSFLPGYFRIVQNPPRHCRVNGTPMGSYISGVVRLGDSSSSLLNFHKADSVLHEIAGGVTNGRHYCSPKRQNNSSLTQEAATAAIVLITTYSSAGKDVGKLIRSMCYILDFGNTRAMAPIRRN